MEDKLKNCLNTSIPTTDESQIECRGFISSACIIQDDKTQQEINAELQQQLDEMREMLIQILQQPLP